MNKELTVGLLVSGISDNFTVPVCTGAMKTAKECGIKLVILPGKYWDRDLTEKKEILYEYQYNTLFSYAKGNNFDAVMIAADSIGCYATSSRIRELVEQYSEIPCVLIASKIEGYVSVNYDNYSGISEAMNYLIHELGMTNIGMIGGPDDNTDARERKNAFARVLRENGIPFCDRYYAEGTLSRYSEAAFDDLLDKNPDIQAIFCVNDDTAIGLYEKLKSRNLLPGKHVMVFGYDNMLLASKMKPPLSSVWADPVQLGEEALKMVLRMLNGEQVDNKVLPTKFIKRDSLGAVKKQAWQQSERRLDRRYIDEYFDDIFYRYKNEDDNESFANIKKSYKKLMERVIELYEAGKATVEQKNEIIRMLETVLSFGALDYADVENFLTHVEQLHLAFQQRADGEWYDLESTFSTVYCKTVMAIEQRFGRMSATAESSQYAMKLLVRDIMQFEKGTDQSYAVLLEHLGWLDIKKAYLYVFEKPMVHLEHEELELPDKLYLKAVLREGKVKSILRIYQERKTSEIFRDSKPSPGAMALVTLPLFSNEMLYGILLCDMTEKLFENGEFLTNQMGAAIKTLELLKANEQIQRQLEESLITLKENNIALDTLSKSDVLTGILNRRGFYDSGEKLLDENCKMGVNTLVAYIDMNNLKIINDRYGHDEGDFSIKLISDILTDIVADTGLVGRVGGDEFGLMLTVSPTEQGKAFVERVYERFRSYNETSNKPYNVTVSVGTCIVKAEDSLTLKEALTLADGKLYEEKQFRVKSVAK